MNGLRPTDKVSAAVAGGAAATIIVWLITSLTTLDPTAGVEGAFATLGAFAAAWLTRERD